MTACPCGCTSAACCECCLWLDHPRTELERRGDMVAEFWQHVMDASPSEQVRLAAEYRKQQVEGGR